MALITLVAKDLAFPGYEFTYLGPGEECRNCSVKNICLGQILESHRYKVTSPRNDIKHCLTGETDYMVVEVEDIGET